MRISDWSSDVCSSDLRLFDVIEKPPFFMKQGGPTVIHVSTKTAEVDPVYFPNIEVIGDIANAVWQMKEDIVPNGGWKFDDMLRYRRGEVEPRSEERSVGKGCVSKCRTRW